TLDLGGQGLIALSGGSTFSMTAGPVLRLSGSALSARSLFAGDGTGNSVHLTGGLFDLTGSSVTLDAVSAMGSSDSIVQTLGPSDSVARLSGSQLSVTNGPLVGHRLVAVTSAPVVALSDGSSLSLGGSVLDRPANSLVYLGAPPVVAVQGGVAGG